jgi:hypothetical protein
VVVHAQVVVDCLGDVEDLQRVVRLVRQRVHDARGLGRVVAADVEEVLDVLLRKDLEDALAVRLVRLVARRPEGGGGGAGDALEQIFGHVVERDEVLAQDPLHAVAGAEQVTDVLRRLRRLDHADERLVDDRRRPAGLTDDGVGWVWHKDLVRARGHAKARPRAFGRS